MTDTLFDQRIACPTCGIHLPTLSRLQHHTATAHANRRVILLETENTTIDLRGGLVRLRRT